MNLFSRILQWRNKDGQLYVIEMTLPCFEDEPLYFILRDDTEPDNAPDFGELNEAAQTDYRSAKTFKKWAKSVAPPGADVRIVPLADAEALSKSNPPR